MEPISEESNPATSWRSVLDSSSILCSPNDPIEVSEQHPTGGHYSYKYDKIECSLFNNQWVSDTAGERTITVKLETPWVDDNGRNPPKRAHLSCRTSSKEIKPILYVLYQNAEYQNWLESIDSGESGSSVTPFTVTLPSVLFHRNQYLGPEPLEIWDTFKESRTGTNSTSTVVEQGVQSKPAFSQTQIFAEEDVKITICCMDAGVE